MLSRIKAVFLSIIDMFIAIFKMVRDMSRTDTIEQENVRVLIIVGLSFLFIGLVLWGLTYVPSLVKTLSILVAG
jgi:hypothetical protein